MTRRTALWALAVAIMATGCADKTLDGTATQLVSANAQSLGPFVEVGTCFAGSRLGDKAASDMSQELGLSTGAAAQLADDPTWTDPVNCVDDHMIEVYGVVQLPADLDASVTGYADLIDVSTPLYRAVRDNVVHQCSRQVSLVAAVADDTRLDLDIVPMIGAETQGRRAWDPVPYEVWQAGQRSFVCTYQQATEDDVQYGDILTGSFPDGGRSCLAGELFVACTEPHDTERVAVLVVDRSIDRGLLSGASAVTSGGMVDLGSSEWTMLDDVCQRYLNAIAPDAPDGIFGVANTYPELYPNEFGSFNILCLAGSPFGTDPADLTTMSASVYEG